MYRRFGKSYRKYQELLVALKCNRECVIATNDIEKYNIEFFHWTNRELEVINKSGYIYKVKLKGSNGHSSIISGL